MAFATATIDKVIAYLGYAYTNEDIEYVQAALDAVEALTDSTTSGNAVTRIEAALTRLDAIESSIDTEAGTEGSTLLTPLRYEGRRHVSLVARSLGLEVRSDVFASSPDETP
jgi:hypothetical protein